MILGDWHAEFKAEYHKEELCQVLKNFTGILNFLVKQFNQFRVERHRIVGEEFIIRKMIFKFDDILNEI